MPPGPPPPPRVEKVAPKDGEALLLELGEVGGEGGELFGGVGRHGDRQHVACHACCSRWGECPYGW